MRPLKLMWLPDGDILWDVVTESSLTEEILPRLTPQLRQALNAWSKRFAREYERWLCDNSAAVIEVSGPLVSHGRSLASRIHDETGAPTYYWFDVDRTVNPRIRWKTCPLCHKSVARVQAWDRKNRYRCHRCGLVFPEPG